MRYYLLLSFLFVACEPELLPHYADIEVDRDLDSEELPEGDPEITPGIYEEQLFSPVEEGDDMHVIHGFQGGIWVHLSIRVNGMRSLGRIYAALGDDGAIGETSYDLRLSRTPEGFLEAYDIPIPVSYRGDDLPGYLESIYGESHRLTVRFKVRDKTASDERIVVLEPG